MQTGFTRMLGAQRCQRVFIGFMACLFIFMYLVSTLVHSDKETITTTQVVYSYPEEIFSRITRLEAKVSNFTDTFTRLTAKGGGKNIIKHFITSNVHSFWYSYRSPNSSVSFDNVYKSNSSNHTTKLVSSHTCIKELKLLILITTHVSHFEQRELIRNTWGKDTRQDQMRWKTYFLVGRARSFDELEKLMIERDRFGDLVIGDVNEDFYNLTYKVQMGFEWAVRYCTFEFMLKGDDDVFVHMPNLFNFLDHRETMKTELYAGNVNYDAVVAREGKYGIEKSEFNKRIYPRYCSGGGFILSYDVVKIMEKLFYQVKAIKIDDAYVGEVALKGGIDVLHNEHFRMFEDEKKCAYNPDTIIHHPAKTASCMNALYKESLKIR